MDSLQLNRRRLDAPNPNNMGIRLQLQLIVMSATIAFFTYLYFEFPFSLGGSYALCLLIGLFCPILIRRKDLANLLGIFFLILSGIMVLNFLAYLEIANGIGVPDLVIFVVTLHLTSLCFLMSTELGYRQQTLLNEDGLKHLRSFRKTLITAIVAFGTGFPLLGCLMVVLIAKDDPHMYNNIPLLRMSYVGCALFILGLFAAHHFLKVIGDRELEELLSKDRFNFTGYDARSIKKWSLLIGIFLIIMGSGFEIQRGMWIMWVETIAMLVPMSLILWRIYKFYLLGVHAHGQ